MPCADVHNFLFFFYLGGSCLLKRLYSAGLAVMKMGIGNGNTTAGTHIQGTRDPSIHPLPGQQGGWAGACVVESLHHVHL